MRVYYSKDYTRAGHSFDTTRKAAWVAESLRSEPIACVELVAPEPCPACVPGSSGLYWTASDRAQRPGETQ